MRFIFEQNHWEIDLYALFCPIQTLLYIYFFSEGVVTDLTNTLTFVSEDEMEYVLSQLFLQSDGKVLR